MAETQENSDLLQNFLSSPQQIYNKGANDGDWKDFSFTQGAAAGDAGSRQRLFVLKANERLFLHQFSIRYSAFGAGRTLNFGHEQYQLADGTVIAENLTAIATGLDVSGAGRAIVNDSPTTALERIEYPVDVVIVSSVAGGTIPSGATLNGTAPVARGK